MLVDAPLLTLLALALFLIALVALLLVAILVHTRALARRVDELRDEVRYDIPPARRAIFEGSILTLPRGAGASEAEAGVAFFVSPTAALTAAHTRGARGLLAAA